jgi:hypothetical protein
LSKKITKMRDISQFITSYIIQHIHRIINSPKAGKSIAKVFKTLNYLKIVNCNIFIVNLLQNNFRIMKLLNYRIKILQNHLRINRLITNSKVRNKARNIIQKQSQIFIVSGALPACKNIHNIILSENH